MISWLGDIYSRIDVFGCLKKIPSKSRVRPVLSLSLPLVLDKELQAEAFKDHQPISTPVHLLEMLNLLLPRINGE